MIFSKVVWTSWRYRIDDLTSGAVGGIPGLAKHAADAKVAAGVDSGREPGGLAFHLSVEAGEVGLVEDFLDLFRVGIGVQDT